MVRDGGMGGTWTHPLPCTHWIYTYIQSGSSWKSWGWWAVSAQKDIETTESSRALDDRNRIRRGITEGRACKLPSPGAPEENPQFKGELDCKEAPSLTLTHPQTGGGNTPAWEVLVSTTVNVASYLDSVVGRAQVSQPACFLNEPGDPSPRCPYKMLRPCLSKLQQTTKAAPEWYTLSWALLGFSCPARAVPAQSIWGLPGLCPLQF